MTRLAGLYRLGLAALAVAVVSMSVNAQPPGGGRGGPGGPGGGPGFGGRGPGGGGTLGLLMIPQVREELDVTDEQMEKLRQKGEQLREQMRGLFPDREALANLSDEERRARFEKAREESEKKVNAALKEVLVPAQIERLEQIELQQQGTRALLTDKVVKALKITPEQKTKLEKIGDEGREQMRGMFEGMRGLRDMPQDQRDKKMAELREKGDQLRKESEKKAMAVLSDDQKTALGKMMGKPFEMPRPEGRPGGGRSFRGRGGDGQRGPRGQGQRDGGNGRNRPAPPQA